jgi:hypothetical protein
VHVVPVSTIMKWCDPLWCHRVKIYMLLANQRSGTSCIGRKAQTTLLDHSVLPSVVAKLRHLTGEG